MKSSTSKLVRAMSLVLLLASLTGFAFGQSTYRLQLDNSSGYEVNHVYMSPSGDSDWGHDLLGWYVLNSPGSFDITNIVAGENYDLKLIDEDGDYCELHNLQFFNNQIYYITQTWLLGCEARTEGL